MTEKKRGNDKWKRYAFKLKFNYLIEDFKVMTELVKWCDSFTRYSQLHFTLLKDLVCLETVMARDIRMSQYMHEITFMTRLPEHRKPYDRDKIEEFKEFFLKKFKKASPKIEEVIQNGRK